MAAMTWTVYEKLSQMIININLNIYNLSNNDVSTMFNLDQNRLQFFKNRQLSNNDVNILSYLFKFE